MSKKVCQTRTHTGTPTLCLAYQLNWPSKNMRVSHANSESTTSRRLSESDSLRGEFGKFSHKMMGN